MNKEIVSCGTCKHLFTKIKNDPCKECKNFEKYEKQPFNCGGCKYYYGTFRICKDCTDFDKYEREEVE